VHKEGQSPVLVRALTAEAPCAGAGQRKARRSLFDQPVHFVQDLWNSLHLIHDNPSISMRRDEISRPIRMGDKLRVQSAVKKVKVDRFRQPIVEPRGLARPARTEEKKVLARLKWLFQQSGIHSSI
jgi:hypothetical protein